MYQRWARYTYNAIRPFQKGPLYLFAIGLFLDLKKGYCAIFTIFLSLTLLGFDAYVLAAR